MSIHCKKYYSTPLIETVRLDNSIDLLEPTGNPPGMAAPTDRDTPSFGPSSIAPSSKSDPFGGSRPDYGDM